MKNLWKMVVLSFAIGTALADNATSETTIDSDPYLWLEEVEGQQPLDWVKQQNAVTVDALANNDSFKAMKQRLLDVMNSKEKIPYVNKMGDYVYNFWRDAQHEKGLWRRTSLSEFQKADPSWEIVLDVDALAKADGVSWVFKGANCLYPDYQRCLINLSRGGADATVIREFDLQKKQFVENGFSLPESKGGASWFDENTLLVGRDFGADSLTDSGYPRQARLWKRGQPLEQAEVVFSGEKADVSAGASRSLTKGFERTFYYRAKTFYTNEFFLVQDGKPIKVEKPDDANASAYREWLLITLKSDWQVADKTWPSGAVLITKFDDFLVGKRDFQMLFTPGPRKSLAGLSFTKNHILLNELENVRNKVFVLSLKDGQWQREALNGLPALGTVSVWPVDDEDSDQYWLNVTDYLTPSQLWIGTIGQKARTKLKQLPAFFDSKNLVSAQHEATSKDGTKVPYFIVHRKGINLNGKNPTLLYGYGGFQVSLTPGYSANAGIAWLEKGGVYVVANIRGGGEFGPAWHQAALKEKRHKAYEDFVAVAEDLIARKITASKHLGIQGGSNGGLLMGNMITMRPDLFGAVVCQVPLLDMKRYNKLLAGASWMAEYGNPDIPEQWQYLQQYSPYHNLQKDTRYPAVLFTTSTRDDRVHPGHARKMAKKMADEYAAPVWYYENIEGGHGGAANNEQAAFMSALAYAFLWEKLN